MDQYEYSNVLFNIMNVLLCFIGYRLSCSLCQSVLERLGPLSNRMRKGLMLQCILRVFFDLERRETQNKSRSL